MDSWGHRRHSDWHRVWANFSKKKDKSRFFPLEQIGTLWGSESETGWELSFFFSFFFPSPASGAVIVSPLSPRDLFQVELQDYVGVCQGTIFLREIPKMCIPHVAQKSFNHSFFQECLVWVCYWLGSSLGPEIEIRKISRALREPAIWREAEKLVIENCHKWDRMLAQGCPGQRKSGWDPEGGGWYLREVSEVVGIPDTERQLCSLTSLVTCASGAASVQTQILTTSFRSPAQGLLIKTSESCREDPKAPRTRSPRALG